MKHLLFSAGLAALLGTQSPVWANENDLSEAGALYQQGAYEEALSLIRSPEDLDGLLLRAEIQSMRILLGFCDDPRAVNAEARALAREVLELDPDNREARIQMALTEGFALRMTPPRQAFRSGAPRDLKKTIVALTQDVEGDARVPALYAAWHLGIVRRAGGWGSRFYGAKLEDGIALYEQAIQMDPQDAIIHSTYAMTLLAMDAEKYKPRATELLKYVAALNVESAIDIEIQNRAAGMLAIIDDDEDLQKIVTDYLDNVESMMGLEDAKL